ALGAVSLSSAVERSRAGGPPAPPTAEGRRVSFMRGVLRRPARRPSAVVRLYLRRHRLSCTFAGRRVSSITVPNTSLACGVPMASDRLPPTLADYVVIVISPALIMGLVGSLAFFILEVMYRGQYEGKLQWTVFFVVFGSVLLGRLSMMAEIAGRYWIYAPILGLVTLLVLAKYVDYLPEHPAAPYRVLINLGLVLVVLWSTYQLTWDCTHIDNDGDPT